MVFIHTMCLFIAAIYAQTQWTRDYRVCLDIQGMLFASGIEHQPGPQSPGDNFILDVGNITCLSSHLQDVADIDAHAFVFQEHSCPSSERPKMYKFFKKARRKLILGPLDPEVKHNLGGVGISTTHTRPAIRVKPRTTAFKTASQSGRCDLYALDIGHALPCRSTTGMAGRALIRTPG